MAVKGSAIRQPKYAGSATARIALLESRSDRRPHRYMVSAFATWLEIQRVVAVPMPKASCFSRYTVLNGAARFEAKFHDAMKTMTRRKSGSPNGMRSMAASGVGGPVRAMAGSGTVAK